MPIFTTLNPKGGAGKSTTALQLIQALHPDLIIDIDDQQTITQFNQVRQALGFKPFNVATPRSQKEFKDLVENNQDNTILIDAVGVDSDYNRQILAVADVIISPCDDEPASILGLQRLAFIKRDVEEHMKKVGVDIKINISTFYNRANHARKNFEEFDALCEKLGFQPMKTRIIKHNLIAYSAASGQTVQESSKDPTHRAVTGYADLVKEAQGRL